MSCPPRLCSISRRAILAGGVSWFAEVGAAAAASMPARLAFAALRNGRKIGEQHMTFDRSDGLLARTQTELTVMVGPIALYRYRHEATERWLSDRFESLDTRTSDNGKLLQVSARREDDQVTISTAAGVTLRVSKDALPFTHWNRAIAKAPLFNPQDGKVLRETVAPPVSGSVTLADGSTRAAEGVMFRGEVYIEDWYDADGVWTGLIGRLKDGSVLEYRRL